MNLIDDTWIPVRRHSGIRALIAPWQIAESDDPVIAIDSGRPDFDDALFQFLIGLLQTLCAPTDELDWADRLDPPAVERLRERFATVADAFGLDGDGPRFMQDFDAKLGPAENDIDSLLIEAPGGQTKRNNADHFIKGGLVGGICPACAAQALLTLNTNAPAGGAGIRTSLRGGGPLTTLLRFDPQARRDGQPVMLWHDLWLNVLTRQRFFGHWHGADDARAWFPWLSPTRTSEKNEQITAADAHPAVAFWATPRRIRLDWSSTTAGHCDLCGAESERLVQRYASRPRGANYTTWLHPLSPYYRLKATSTEWLPQHPQPGGIGYRHWPELLFGDEASTRRPAAVIVEKTDRVLGEVDPQRWNTGLPLLLWAGGYDMDNMKARCWYEARMPVFTSGKPEVRKELRHLSAQFVEAAGLVRACLGSAVRAAWFARPADAKGDFGFLDRAFWDATETPFFRLVQTLSGIDLTRDASDALRLQARESWLQTLRTTARHLFDLWADSGGFDARKPERLAAARDQLGGQLNGPKLRTVLGLPVPLNEKDRKPARRARKESST